MVLSIVPLFFYISNVSDTGDHRLEPPCCPLENEPSEDLASLFMDGLLSERPLLTAPLFTDGPGALVPLLAGADGLGCGAAVAPLTEPEDLFILFTLLSGAGAVALGAGDVALGAGDVVLGAGATWLRCAGALLLRGCTCLELSVLGAVTLLLLPGALVPLLSDTLPDARVPVLGVTLRLTEGLVVAGCSRRLSRALTAFVLRGAVAGALSALLPERLPFLPLSLAEAELL